MELKGGDRVVFFGDSITEQQLYTVYVEAFIRTRFPSLDISFFNRGWGGDTCAGFVDLGGLNEMRIKRDVAPLKPTAVTVMFGMNDGCYIPYNLEIGREFRHAYARMLDNLQSAARDARFTLIRTSPWDQYTCSPASAYPGAPYPPEGYNDALLRYGEAVEELARERAMKFVDFNLPMVEVMKTAKERDLALARQIVPDWIHPGPPGHLIMAGELLKAWDMPALVSEVHLDAGSKSVREAGNGEVRGFNGTSWTQTEGCLPFCVSVIDPAVLFVLDLYDFQERLNRQMLTINRLQPGAYGLWIDGKHIGQFSHLEFAKGVNLARYGTPMTSQALEVLSFVTKRSALQMTRWRQIDVNFELFGAAAEASHGLEELEDRMIVSAKEEAMPKERFFEITAV